REKLVHKDLLAVLAREIDVPHRQSYIAEDLNRVAAFNGIVITALNPGREGKPLVSWKLRITAHKVSQRALPGRAKSLRRHRQRGPKENSAFFEVIRLIDHLRGRGLIVTVLLIDLTNLHQAITPGLLRGVYFRFGNRWFVGRVRRLAGRRRSGTGANCRQKDKHE